MNMKPMSKTEFLTQLTAQRDYLYAKHEALIQEGKTFQASDMMADIRFACRALYEALTTV